MSELRGCSGSSVKLSKRFLLVNLIFFSLFKKPLFVGKHRKFFKTGDMAIVVTGWRPGSGYTNTMRVVLVP